MHNLDIFSLTWVFTICAVFIAAFIRGVTGFGLALILAPVLLLVLKPASVVVVNLLLGSLSNIVVLAYSIRNVNLGIPVGAWIITHIVPSTLKILIGGVTVFFAIILTLGFSKTFKREKIAGSIAGLLSGVLTSSTSLGGPPVVLFMHNQNWSNQTIHSGLAAYFLFTGFWSLVAG